MLSCLTVQKCNILKLLLVVFQMGLWRSFAEFNVLSGPAWSSIGVVPVHRDPPSRLCSSPTLKRMETPICWGHWLEPGRISGNLYCKSTHQRNSVPFAFYHRSLPRGQLVNYLPLIVYFSWVPSSNDISQFRTPNRLFDLTLQPYRALNLTSCVALE